MAIQGSLSTFALPDLLQWVESVRKSGVLALRSGTITRHVVFTDGRITACTSDDPTTRLGQTLVARGIIDEATLRSGLEVQERTGGTLGAILVEMKAATSEEIVHAVAAKAEDTIYALFDDDSAEFRFEEGVEAPDWTVPADLKIQDVLLRGLQRLDEMRRIRELFPSQGVVLARTERAVPERVLAGRVAGRIIRAIDGRRSIAEVLLHARASEYLVSKFLFELHRQGLVRIVEIRNPQEPPDPPAPRAQAPPPAAEGDRPDAEGVAAVGLDAELAVAEHLLDRSEADAALAVLEAAGRAHPDSPSVRALMDRAATDRIDDLRRRIPPQAVPIRVRDISRPDGDTLNPGEAFVFSLLDGRTDVRSFVWTVPMREIELLRSLDGLVVKGVVQLATEI